MNFTELDLQALAFLAKGFAFTTFVLLAAALIVKRVSAQAISLYWRACIVGLIALPLVALFLPILPAWKASEAPVVRPETATLYAPALASSHEFGNTTPATSQLGSSSAARVALSWIACLWLLGACGVLLRWAIARLKVSRLCRDARPSDPLEWLEGDRPAARLRVFISETTTLPMVWGTFRPILLLPKQAEQWDEPTRRAVLAHEITHVRRRDSLFLMLSQLAVALHWPNPLAWIAARKLRLADERSADDSVLAIGAEPSEYASLLVDFAKRGNASSLGLPIAAPSMAHPSTIGRRVERLLDRTQRRGTPQLCQWLGSALAVVTLAATIGALTNKPASAQAEPATRATPTPKVEGSIPYISQKLEKTVLPKIKLENATLEEAIEYLRLQSVAHDPIETEEKRKGIDIVVKTWGVRSNEPKINLELANVPLRDALHRVTELSGTEYKIEPIAVVVAPQLDSNGALYTRTFRVAPQFLEAVGSGSAKDLLVRRGVAFPDGASAAVNAENFELITRNTGANMELIQSIVFAFNADPVVVKKLKDIVLPTVRFDKVTIEEALEFFRQKSKELDEAEKDLQKKGVNIVLRRSPDAPDNKQPTITMNLENIPLGDGLGFVAKSAGLEMQVLPFGVVMGKNLPPVVPKPKLDPPAPILDGRAYIEKKLKTIIVPKIRFDKVTLREALVVLRQKAVEFDTTEKDPKQKGVNIVIRGTPDAPGAPVAPDPVITLDLVNVSLAEALGFVAKLAKVEMRIEPIAVVLGNDFPPVRPAKPAPKLTAAQLKIAKKAREIIIPRFAVEGASVEEAVELLRIKSREHDPEKRGMNILIQKDAVPDDAAITLNLSKVPLADVMHYVAESAGAELTLSDFAFEIAPKAAE